MAEVDTYSFGEWLRQRRERLRLTQRALAVTVHCSVAMIKKIEADERRPSPDLARLLAVTLQIPEPQQPLFVEVARGTQPLDRLWHQQDAVVTPAFPVPSPSQLPRPVTPFIGRVDELKGIGERLLNPECRLLTLVGPGGIGKTRLALAAAQETTFAGEVAFISLAAITDTGFVPDTIARTLRLTLSGPPAEQVIAYLRQRSLLLILDNCEQLQGDLSWVSELLSSAPGVKLLATSRERLHLVEEWVYMVPELAQSEALFINTARRVKQDFDAEGERAAVQRICRLVENLPLAVELAASWTPLMPCAQIADSIQRDINILASDVHNVPDRHRSIQAVFDHSWNLLDLTEKNALMRLSVFRGGWQVDEVLLVAGADLLLLRRLVDKSLVRVGENGRFDLHELIRQFTSHQLSESGQETETRRRHFNAYLALAAQLDNQQFGPDSMTAIARYDQEQDNYSAALEWSLESEQTELALNLLNHLWFYWARRGYYQEGGQWASRAIHQAGELESVELCIALSSAATFSFIRGHFAEGEALAFRALEMAHRLDDPEALIMAYGTYTFTSVNVEQALQGLHKGIALIYETGKMQPFLPMYYLGAATWYHSSGQYPEAEEYYRKSMTLFRQMSAIDMVAEPLGRLGELALQDGRLQEAYALTVESLLATRAAGNHVGFGEPGGVKLGLIQQYLGDVEAAQRTLEHALLLFEDSPAYERTRLDTLVILSEVALARGDLQAASDYLQASLNICEKFYRQLQATQKLEGTPDALPVDLIGLCSRAAHVAAAQGNPIRAVTLYSIADSLRTQSRQWMIPALQAKLDKLMADLRTLLSEEMFAAAWENGQNMPLAEAFEFLLF